GDTLAALARTHRAVATVLRSGRVRACHDVGDGGILVALAEMCIASGLGAVATFPAEAGLFQEGNGLYLLAVRPEGAQAVTAALGDAARVHPLAEADATARLRASRGAERLDVPVDDLRAAWRRTLDW